MSTAPDGLTIARVNGVPLHEPGETLSPVALRQRACVELLRQAATREGVADSASDEAIERWLDDTLDVVEPDVAACRRHYEAEQARYRVGERLTLRHILFAVTPGIDVDALRRRAEGLLVELRTQDATAFARAATQWSNCPSGADGGDLGSIGRADCADEFAREVFGHEGLGVLPRLVHSRFGFHIVDVVARAPGRVAAFEDVEGAVKQALERQAWSTAVRRLVSELASAARVEGVDLAAADLASL